MENPKDIADDIVRAVIEMSARMESREEPVVVPVSELRDLVKGRVNALVVQVALERGMLLNYGQYLQAHRGDKATVSFDDFLEGLNHRQSSST